MRLAAISLAVFCLTFASWPGGPLANAHISAHGAMEGELSNGPMGAIPAPADDSVVESFDLIMVNTQERGTIHLFGRGSRPDAESIATFKHLMRAYPFEKEGPVNLPLIETLHQIAKATGAPIELVSGYRLPQHRWDHNYHVRGQAADIRVPGVPTYKLVRLAKKLGVLGVGNYPTSAFVHVDTRDTLFYWTDWSGPGR